MDNHDLRQQRRWEWNGTILCFLKYWWGADRNNIDSGSDIHSDAGDNLNTMPNGSISRRSLVCGPRRNVRMERMWPGWLLRLWHGGRPSGNGRLGWNWHSTPWSVQKRQLVFGLQWRRTVEWLRNDGRYGSLLHIWDGRQHCSCRGLEWKRRIQDRRIQKRQLVFGL